MPYLIKWLIKQVIKNGGQEFAIREEENSGGNFLGVKRVSLGYEILVLMPKKFL